MKGIILLMSVGILIIGCGRIAPNRSKENPLNGIWTNGSGLLPTLILDNDSVSDTNLFKVKKFADNRDTITVYYPLDIAKLRFHKIHEDTLLFEFNGLTEKYWRLKD